VNPSQLRTDDELLTALAGGEELLDDHELTPARDEIGWLLANWRAAIDATPLPELVDTELAIATLTRAKQRAKLKRRLPPCYRRPARPRS
jgi:hypothetical protein